MDPGWRFALHPNPGSGARARLAPPVVRIGDPADVKGQASAADAIGQAVSKPLEFCSSLIYSLEPFARQLLPIIWRRGVVVRELGEFLSYLFKDNPIRCAKTMNAILRSTDRW